MSTSKQETTRNSSWKASKPASTKRWLDTFEALGFAAQALEDIDTILRATPGWREKIEAEVPERLEALNMSGSRIRTWVQGPEGREELTAYAKAVSPGGGDVRLTNSQIDLVWDEVKTVRSFASELRRQARR